MDRNSIENDISLIHEISDEMAFRIITSIRDSPKAVTQISIENNIPLSSTYKKIKKLQKYGVVRIHRSEIDESGKRVLFYKSNIASFEFKIEKKRRVFHSLSNDSIELT
jgi:predicted transcriptional regulator